jgi:hypothetical protein
VYAVQKSSDRYLGQIGCHVKIIQIPTSGQACIISQMLKTASRELQLSEPVALDDKARPK